MATDQCETGKLSSSSNRLYTVVYRDRPSVTSWWSMWYHVTHSQWLLCLCRQERTVHTTTRVCEEHQTGPKGRWV